MSLKSPDTPSGHNAVWHGYSPNNLSLVQRYLTVFRVINNFILVGKDGCTRLCDWVLLKNLSGVCAVEAVISSE